MGKRRGGRTRPIGNARQQHQRNAIHKGHPQPMNSDFPCAGILPGDALKRLMYQASSTIRASSREERLRLTYQREEVKVQLNVTKILEVPPK